MLEGKVDHVIGVDTHRDRHAAAILDRNGGVVAELKSEATRPAASSCWVWRSCGPGPPLPGPCGRPWAVPAAERQAAPPAA
jgi:hypothetical protein